MLATPVSHPDHDNHHHHDHDPETERLIVRFVTASNKNTAPPGLVLPGTFCCIPPRICRLRERTNID